MLMDALVTYGSSESDDECEDHLSSGAANGFPAICCGNDGVKRKQDMTILSQCINQTGNFQLCEDYVMSVLDDFHSVAEHTKEVADEPSVTSTMQDFFSLAEQKTASVDESPVTSAVEDFFNLAEPTNVSVADDLPGAPLSCDSKQQSTTENAYTVNFWHTDTTAEDWTHPEKIWGATPDSTENECGYSSNKTVNLCSGGKVSEIKGYSSKRRHSYISNKSLVIAESSTVTKRSCFTVHHKIAPHLHTTIQSSNRIPKKIIQVLPGHSGTVNRIHWGIPEYGHLLLTASMDATVRVWNVFSARDSDPCVRTLKVHSKAVKAARWSACGRQILSCSYDKSATLTDVECGTVLSASSVVVYYFALLLCTSVLYRSSFDNH